MAITYVGGTSGAGTSNGYTVSLSGTLTGGSNTSPSPGDLVVVFSGFGNTASSAPNVSGNNFGAYTPATAAQHVNDAWDTEFRSFYAIMGSSVDTTLTVTRVTNTAYGGATVVQVWRGVNPANPFIGAATPASGINTSLVNPPAYNPSVTDSIIIAGGAGTQSTTGAAFTGFSGMSNFITRKGDGTTSDLDIAIASFAYAGSSYDPAIVSGGTGGNASSSWAGVTMAFRPSIDHPTTGALSGPGAVVAGSAARASPSVSHATSGALSGPGSTVAGSATRFRAFATSGALTGPGSTVAASATRFRAFATSGALTGPGSTVAGSASRTGGTVSHATTGALTGPGSTVAGSASRFRAFSTSGVLAGQGSAISGSAARTGAPVTHGTTGELIGQGSALAATASVSATEIPQVAPPIAYWDVTAMQPQTPTKKKQRKQELETMFLLLG